MSRTFHFNNLSHAQICNDTVGQLRELYLNLCPQIGFQMDGNVQIYSSEHLMPMERSLFKVCIEKDMYQMCCNKFNISSGWIHLEGKIIPERNWRYLGRQGNFAFLLKSPYSYCFMLMLPYHCYLFLLILWRVLWSLYSLETFIIYALFVLNQNHRLELRKFRSWQIFRLRRWAAAKVVISVLWEESVHVHLMWLNKKQHKPPFFSK